MANKTKVQRYNENLLRICQPEIDRLQKLEAISKEILDNLNKRVNIDYCGLEEWHLVDIITRVIDKNRGR